MTRSFILVFVVFATSLSSAAVHRNRVDLCSSKEFTCGDGSCVPQARLCDGQRDCSDASDEAVCFLPSRNNTDLSVWGRAKRQAACHPKNQWQCRDGTCIGFDGECDGVVDCPDGSDETYPRCRGKECQANWFRCTYGACVDGTAACNGVQDCADNSDELDPSCRKETDEFNGQFKCQNGQLIQAANRCDGIADCGDYSDESVRACAGRTCPSNLFQCAYGACVDQGSDCNGKTECADGSDESLELCDKTAAVTTERPGGTPVRPGPKPSSGGSCILPQYPDHGTYQVTNAPSAAPGQRFDSVYINVVCNPGYKASGPSEIFCLGGQWSGTIANCVRFCKLNKHSSVEYQCLLTGGTIKGTRVCEDFEPVGTVVIPVCRTPNYYSPNVLNYMHCFEGGEWDYVAVCTPECGTVTPVGTGLVIDGKSAKRGELPWHAGIYRKMERPYMQICGGSLITNKVVVSAAHCFWSSQNKLLPPANYAVGLGKIYRPYGESHDDTAQTSDVQDLKVPSRFAGASSNFQEDIALVFLVNVIVFSPIVRPICLDFDVISDRTQLRDGNLGKVAGWGLTTKDGNPSGVLKVVQLPVVDINRCISESPNTFRQYITSDKFCAGYKNGTTVCRGDSGGGLAFPDVSRQRFYLRGIVSTAPTTDNACNIEDYTTFTQVSRHEWFIKEFVTF